ncbi:BON domain-containing protein [Jannaschia formosa]|uniref:BON domain-containing protein n=1 Tax=Jannaschia formosa TaxID=2259592 RepID=UPI000E1BF85E|nr:BON domain-containing protein [Jannaschia formosa]TFL16391.1 BON domain-containing protein [Jannaschia formosa]
MNDANIKQDVMDALDFEPSIDANDIGVAVDRGIVTLSGHVPTYSQRLTAERVVTRIKGVRGIAQEIEVRPVGSHQTADDEIARRAADLLTWNTAVPKDRVKVKVANGHVTLVGTVEWNYQRNAAHSVVSGMSGVKSVSNVIDIRHQPTPSDIRQRIENALKRDAELDAAAIQVKVSDGIVTLDGRIDSWADRLIAERAAWAAPGIKKVNDHLHVA